MHLLHITKPGMMKKKLFLFAVLLTAMLSFVSCKSKSDKDAKHGNDRVENEAPVNPMVQALDETPDDALLVKLVAVEGDSMRVRVLRTDEEKVFCFKQAADNNCIKGSLNVGDEYSVFTDNASNGLAIVINVTELKGRWYYDMAQHRGLDFEVHGGVSSINADDICFREWKLLNGKLYLYYLKMDMIAPDRNETLVEEATIETLSKDRLVFKFQGRTYKCERMTEVIKMKI